MSVQVDRFIGYSVDIMKEWDKLDSSKQDLLSGTFCKNAESDRLESEFNFVGYYSQRAYESLKGRITVINDGMNGNYVKLMYVLEYESDVLYDTGDALDKVINALLKVDVISHIKEQLEHIYQEFLGSTDEMKTVIPEYLVHYH